MLHITTRSDQEGRVCETVWEGKVKSVCPLDPINFGDCTSLYRHGFGASLLIDLGSFHRDDETEGDDDTSDMYHYMVISQKTARTFYSPVELEGLTGNVTNMVYSWSRAKTSSAKHGIEAGDVYCVTEDCFISARHFEVEPADERLRGFDPYEVLYNFCQFPHVEYAVYRSWEGMDAHVLQCLFNKHQLTHADVERGVIVHDGNINNEEEGVTVTPVAIVADDESRPERLSCIARWIGCTKHHWKTWWTRGDIHNWMYFMRKAEGSGSTTVYRMDVTDADVFWALQQHYLKALRYMDVRVVVKA